MNGKIQKMIAMLLLGWLFFWVITIGLGSLVDTGVILDAWYNMLGYIPFGGWLAQLCVDLFEQSFNMGQGLVKYTQNIQPMDPLLIFNDSCILILTAMTAEAGNAFIQALMEVGKKEKGIADVIMRMVSGMISVLLCTFVATMLMNFLYGQLASVSSAVQWVVSTLVSLITVGGAVGIFYLILGAGVLQTIAYVGIKIIFVNVFKVLATYLGVLLILLFIGEEAYVNAFAAFAGWGVVIVILIGVDIMISSMF